MSMLLEIATRSKSKKYPVNPNPRTSQAWEDVFGTKLRARWTPVHLRECMRGDDILEKFEISLAVLLRNTTTSHAIPILSYLNLYHRLSKFPPVQRHTIR